MHPGVLSVPPVLLGLLAGFVSPATMAQEVTLPDGSTRPVYPETCELPEHLNSPCTTTDGREVLTLRLADGSTALVDVTRVDDTELHNGMRTIFGPGRQLLVGCADFPTLARTGLHSDEELTALTSITGRSLEDLDHLGQPGQLSAAGFLARGENIRTVLRTDNQVVAAMGLSHPQLARPLMQLWNLIRTEVRLGRIRGEASPVCQFRYRDCWVGLRVASSKGWQESLFQDEIIGNSRLWLDRDLTDDEEAFLRRRYPDLGDTEHTRLVQRLTRLHTGEMVAFYIQRYGFYEGHTDFRADPVTLAFLLGFRTLEEIEAALPGRLAALMQAGPGRP